MVSHAPDGSSADEVGTLPQHRRELLLRQFAGELDGVEVDAYVRAASQQPCPWRGHGQHTGETVAITGDDGRYHLVRDDVVLCTGIESRGREFSVDDTALPHRRHYEWWTDEAGKYRFGTYNAPLEQLNATYQCREVEWTVRVGATRVDPSTVSPSQRCLYVGSRSDWPPYATTKTSVGRIRQTLRELAGGQCHACGVRTAVFVDHDHRTGLVRGLLCQHCNVWIDVCPHTQGCPWAEYLNDPPATKLALPYPRKSEGHRRTQRLTPLHAARARRVLRGEEQQHP